MERAVTIGATIGSILMIVDSLNVVMHTIVFFAAGIIPGVDYRISAEAMLYTSTILLGFVLARLTLPLVRFVWQTSLTINLPKLPKFTLYRGSLRRA